MYCFVLSSLGGRDLRVFDKVDDAFAAKGPNDTVFVMLNSTGYRARVLRPGAKEYPT